MSSLSVTVVRAFDLVAKEDNPLLTLANGPSCDPYVCVYAGSELGGRTSTAYRTLDPEWNEQVLMDHLLGSDADKDGVVRFVIFDEDKTADEGALGEIAVPLATIGLGRTLHTTFEIGPCAGSTDNGDFGELEVILVWDLLQDAAARLASKQAEKEKAEARKVKEEQRRKKEQAKKKKKEEDEVRKEEARRVKEEERERDRAERAARQQSQERKLAQTNAEKEEKRRARQLEEDDKRQIAAANKDERKQEAAAKKEEADIAKEEKREAQKTVAASKAERKLAEKENRNQSRHERQRERQQQSSRGRGAREREQFMMTPEEKRRDQRRRWKYARGGGSKKRRDEEFGRSYDDDDDGASAWSADDYGSDFGGEKVPLRDVCCSGRGASSCRTFSWWMLLLVLPLVYFQRLWHETSVHGTTRLFARASASLPSSPSSSASATATDDTTIPKRSGWRAEPRTEDTGATAAAGGGSGGVTIDALSTATKFAVPLTGLGAGLVTNWFPIQAGVVLAPLYQVMDVTHTPLSTLALVSAVHFWGNGVFGTLAWSTRNVNLIVWSTVIWTVPSVWLGFCVGSSKHAGLKSLLLGTQTLDVQVIVQTPFPSANHSTSSAATPPPPPPLPAALETQRRGLRKAARSPSVSEKGKAAHLKQQPEGSSSTSSSSTSSGGSKNSSNAASSSDDDDVAVGPHVELLKQLPFVADADVDLLATYLRMSLGGVMVILALLALVGTCLGGGGGVHRFACPSKSGGARRQSCGSCLAWFAVSACAFSSGYIFLANVGAGVAVTSFFAISVFLGIETRRALPTAIVLGGWASLAPLLAYWSADGGLPGVRLLLVLPGLWLGSLAAPWLSKGFGGRGDLFVFSLLLLVVGTGVVSWGAVHLQYNQPDMVVYSSPLFGTPQVPSSLGELQAQANALQSAVALPENPFSGLIKGTFAPTLSPLPSLEPSLNPTVHPTLHPSWYPSKVPSLQPTGYPTIIATSKAPLAQPTPMPHLKPVPTSLPSQQEGPSPSTPKEDSPPVPPASGKPASQPNGPKPEAKPEPKPAPQPAPRPKPEPKPEPKPSPEPAPKPSPKPESKPATKPIPALKPAQRPEPKVESKPESKPEPKPE